MRRAWTPPAPRRARTRRSAPPAARSTRRCAFCRARSARRCSRSTASAAASTTSPIRPRRGRSGWPSSPNGATRSTRSMTARSAPRSLGLAEPVREFDLVARGFPHRHRRHGDGRARRHPRAEFRDARPLLRSCGERRRAALGARVRYRARRRQAALASSRPGAAAHQHPARSRRGRRRRTALSSARGAAAGRHHDHRSGDGVAQSRRWRRRAPKWSSVRACISPKPRRSWGARHAARCARRGSWARSIAPSSTAWSRAASMRRARRCACLARTARSGSAAVRAGLMPRTIHIIGAGLAGLSAAVDLTGRGETVVVHEATRFAGGRCRSYHDAAIGMTIDNGNHLLLSGNSRRARLSARARRGASAGRSATGGISVRRSREPRRVDATLQRWPPAVVDLRCAARRVPGTHALDYLPLGRLLWAEHDKSGRRGHPLQRQRLRAPGASAAARRAQHRSGGGLGTARRRGDPRDARGGRTGLPSADRARRLERGDDRAGARVPRGARCRRAFRPSASCAAPCRQQGRCARFRQRYRSRWRRRTS